MQDYLYETHLHTAPVSRCAKASVRESLEFYKQLGYAGVFITNHFIDGNMNMDKSFSYEERINFYFSDYEEGARLAEEIGIAVFCGVESTYKGTDFLVYGLSKEWYLAHPEIEGMKKSQMFSLMMESGALLIQAHPFREASYIDHIRLFPRHMHGVEVHNAGISNGEFCNAMAAHYAKSYGLLPFAGSDNHSAGARKSLAGMSTARPVTSEVDFVAMVKNGEATPFRLDLTEGGIEMADI